MFFHPLSNHAILHSVHGIRRSLYVARQMSTHASMAAAFRAYHTKSCSFQNYGKNSPKPDDFWNDYEKRKIQKPAWLLDFSMCMKCCSFRHWILILKLFGNTFSLGVLFYQPKKKGLRFFLNIGKMGTKLTGSEQIIIQDFSVLL